MNLNLCVLRRAASHAALMTMLGLMSHAAQAFPGAGGMGGMSAKAASAAMPSLPAGNTKAYVGSYRSACMEMQPGELAFEDVLTLTPKDDKTVSVGMEKFIFSTVTCEPDTLMGSVIVPSATWTLDSQVRLGTKLVDEVTVKLPTGKIVVNAKARAKAKGRISAVGSDIRLYYGKGEEMTISDTAQPMEDRGLRYLSGDLLLLDDPTAQGPAGYPNALLETMPFKKQR
jgi:hypothetical protein